MDEGLGGADALVALDEGVKGGLHDGVKVGDHQGLLFAIASFCLVSSV